MARSTGREPEAPERVPVVALTGHLGAGKTTLLNHVLRQPGARLGVVVNDFGTINVDAALVTGQVDEAASIAGGCVCCLVDDGRLDEALERLTHPRLRLDAVIVEASGVAEPASLSALIRSSSAGRVRPGGVIDVVDAVEHFRTLDQGGRPPARYAAATLVVINKCDRLPAGTREATLARLEQRIREVNPDVPVVRTSAGQIDPQLLFDIASTTDPADQLPFAAAARAEHAHAHEHARAVALRSPGPVDPGRLVDLLEDPPPGAYRIKGRVAVRSGQELRGYAVNLVGRSVHVARTAAPPGDSELVALGPHLDVPAAEHRLGHALAPSPSAAAAGLRRLQGHRRRSL